MKTATIGEAREFSLKEIRRNELMRAGELEASLICFEAGQRDEETLHPATSIYQVLEGEALVYQGEDRERLGPGRLLAVAGGEPHVLENAGGGLLVILAIRAA